MDAREKLVELIKYGIRHGLRARSDDRLDYSFEDVADHLITHGVTVQEWIPVAERLPEPNETVLVYRKFWNFGMDRYDGESFIHKDVTHWIPMPRIPEKV